MIFRIAAMFAASMCLLGCNESQNLCDKVPSGSSKGGLLVHFDESEVPFADSSGWNNVIESSGGVFSSTDAIKGRSALFDGTGEIQIKPCISENIVFENKEDFTIDFWVKNISRSRQQPLTIGDGMVTGISFDFGDEDISPTGAAAGFWLFWNSQGAKAIVSGERFQFLDGIWHHIAAVRSAGIITAYIDGTSVGSAKTEEQIGSPTLPTSIGFASSSRKQYHWYGFIDELRIAKGAALWTTNFDPKNYLP